MPVRRDVVCDGLRKIGWEVEKPRAGMFVWAKVPQEHLKGKGTIEYAMDLMEHAEVAISPGGAFGESGENYMRIALVENELRSKTGYSQYKQVRPAKTDKKGQIA